MHSVEKSQPSEAVAAGLPGLPQAAPQMARNAEEPQSETRAPLLGQDQIVKLQKILRSIDHDQLKTVLSALEPNVLRLSLHAIFGRNNGGPAVSTDPSQKKINPVSGLSAHTKILAKSKGASPLQAPKPGETPTAADTKPGGRGALGRSSPRSSTQNNAKIYCPSDKTSIDCLILDKSKSGALVFVDHTDDVPDTFALYDIGDQTAEEEFVHLPHKKCKVVWRKRNKMGVEYVR